MKRFRRRHFRTRSGSVREERRWITAGTEETTEIETGEDTETMKDMTIAGREMITGNDDYTFICYIKVLSFFRYRDRRGGYSRDRY